MELRERLERFEFDTPEHGLTFTQRLARENGWSIGYSARVIAEYKRFIELAATVGHMVTPSDAVDQAWHLHMVYTENYWNKLCGEILGQPLHHGPTKGGSRERIRYEEQYLRTLEAYQQTFNEPPPIDIWPDLDERFRQSIQAVRVDRGKYWIIPKPSWMQMAKVGSLFACPAIAMSLDPFNFDGQTFLLTYLVLIVVGIISGLILRSFASTAESTVAMNPPPAERVGWAATAMLVGGSNRALLAAISRLRASGLVTMTKQRLCPTTNKMDIGPLLYAQPSDAALPSQTASMIQDTSDDLRFVQEIWRKLSEKKNGVKLDTLARSLRGEFNRLTIALEQLSLWTSSNDRSNRAMATAGPLCLVFVLGVFRLLFGLTREKPVGFLIGLLVVTLIAILVMINSTRRRTKLGELFATRVAGQFPKPTAEPKSESASANRDADSSYCMTPFLVGLYGTSLLSSWGASDDMSFYQSLDKQAKSISSDGSGGDVWFGDSGGGGDGGGSDSGGSGCGGGCGGCGGCGG